MQARVGYAVTATERGNPYDDRGSAAVRLE